jgi:exopolyphosphatase/guanosine-5'-triphosphate,3'-diphosphate pyrophosphatase
VREEWELDAEFCQRVLSWAARLHEIGLSIAYSGHHKHGAYITANADMPGFSRQDQQLLSTLILNHRRKPSRESFAQLDDESAEAALELCMLLRLAVRLNRSRNPRPIAPPRLSAKRESLRLQFTPGWLEAHTLSRAELEAEIAGARELGFELSFA